jgi:hypothetical protein
MPVVSTAVTFVISIATRAASSCRRARRPPLNVALIAAVCAAGILVPPAASAYPPWVLAIQDCASNGRLDRHYSHEALTRAIRKMQSDGNEYSDCTRELREALEGGTGRPEGPPPPGIVTESGAVAAGDPDILALQQVVDSVSRDEPPAPIAVAAERISVPAFSTGQLAGIRHWNRLPGPLAVSLAGLAVLCAAGAGAMFKHARRHG